MYNVSCKALYKDKVEKELKEAPIYLTNFKLEIKHSDKYLGQTIQSNQSASALETVKARSGKVKEAAVEVKAILEDHEMKAKGGWWLPGSCGRGPLHKKKHSKNFKTLRREHLIGCLGVKMFLLKDPLKKSS